MAYSLLVRQLVDALRVLPGVGMKSAQRMAFYLLERNREGGQHLAQVLTQAMTQIGHCQRCRLLCETPLCVICENKNRDQSLLCIVEGPLHVVAIEHTGSYHGYYFVLSGHLSPIDGMGPQEIGIHDLIKRIEDEMIKEVVLATNSTVEGEATAYYIAQLMKPKGIAITRIAHGVPLGGELDYIDAGTLSKALVDRVTL